LAETARPVLERIRQDSKRVEEPIRAIVVFIHDHLCEEELSVSAALAGANVHSNTAKMRFRALLRVPIGTYIECLRLEIVIRLFVREPKLRLWEVSEWVGYRREHTFKVAFRRCFESPPGKLRAALAAGTVSEREVIRRLWERGSRKATKRTDLAPAAEATTGPLSPAAGAEEEALQKRIFEEVVWPAMLRADAGERRRLALFGFRFETDALFRGLLRLSREGCRHDRELGVALAQSALDVLAVSRGRLSTSDFAEREVEALACLGNARRLASD